MSQEFRYFGDWRRHDGGIVPRALAEIESSRYGDCKDLASLLSRLLKAVGITSSVALVRRGDNPWGAEPDYELPVTNHFNHAIVRAKVGTRTLWLDATNPVAALVPYNDISGRPAFVLDAQAAHFERLPEAQPQLFGHTREYEYQFKGDDQTDVRLKASFKDLAAFHLANELMMAPRPEVLTSTLDYFSEGQDVISYKYLQEPQTGRALKDITLGLEYRSGRITYNAGADRFFVVPDGILGGAFYETADRESDLKLSDEPFVFKAKRRLTKTRLAQAAPPACRIESEWLNLERSITIEGADVVIAQTIELRRPYIRRSEFLSAAFKRLQRATKSCFYRSGVLVQADGAK